MPGVQGKRRAPKRSTRVRVDNAPLMKAERALRRAEHRGAIDEYNRCIEVRGAFSDGLRRF